MLPMFDRLTMRGNPLVEGAHHEGSPADTLASS